LCVLLVARATAFGPTTGAARSQTTYREAEGSFTSVAGAIDERQSHGGDPSAAPTKSSASEWKKFTDTYGAPWTVRWNRATGTPASIMGRKIATGLGKTSKDEAVETWARGFAETNKTLFGVGSAELDLLSLRRAGGRTHVAFRQLHEGTPVYGAILKMNITEEGDLIRISSSCFPNVRCGWGAKLSPEQAAQSVAAHIRGEQREARGGTKPFALRFERPQGARLQQNAERVIFPMPGASTDPFRLCYLLTIHMDEPLGDWVAVVDASRGIEYVRYNNYRFGTISGTVTGNILPAHYDDTPVAVPFKNETIHVFNAAPVYRWDLSTNPGWTCQGLWAWGVPNGVGGDQGDPAPTTGHTGSTVYGYNLRGGYENNLATTQTLTTGAINCSNLRGTHLSFWRWLGVERAAYDHASIEVSNDGIHWTRIWRSLAGATQTGGFWTRVVYDISAGADGKPSVYIRWGMGPTDVSFTYCGWYIDDVEIYANGGASTTSGAGAYSAAYGGTGNAEVYAELSGPYQDIRTLAGKRVSYSRTMSSGANSWSWTVARPSTIRFWNMDTNPGWTTQGRWAWGVPQGREEDPSSGHTGSNVYGYNLGGAYECNIATPYYLKTPAIDCSTVRGTHLRFWRWLGVEFWDYATVEVSNNGTAWVLVYVNSDIPAVADAAWTQVTYDISAVADGHSSVFIRWGMGPTDAYGTYCGWNIDDVEILADPDNSATQQGLSDYDQVNVFHHMNVARDSLKSFDPAFTGMDHKVPAVVRYGTNYANAFWDGEGLYFGEGDDATVRNPALFADVIYHEFNHGATHQIYPPTMLPYTGEPGALDEAWSDYFACAITGEPLIGDGGFLVGQPWMRNLDNALRFPDDWLGEVHEDSRIVSGALWDLRKALGPAAANRLIHFARFNLPQSFSELYEDMLLTDDNNANLSDGTPNMTAIAQAFGEHGIGGIEASSVEGRPTREVLPNGKLDVGETGNLLLGLTAHLVAGSVQADLTSSDPFVAIHDRTSTYGNLGYGEQKDNSPDPFNVEILPACPDDKILDFTLRLTAAGGFATTRTISLVNAPDQILYDDGRSDDYLGFGAAGGEFAVRFTPLVYPTAITSVRLWSSPASAGSDITIRAWDDDGPGGSPGTQLIPPMTVRTGGSDAWEEFFFGRTTFRVAYQWNMDTNPGWSAPGGWAFGAPLGRGGEHGHPDPASGATGPNVYGYNLAGDYPNIMQSAEYLRTSAIDCSNLRGVHLRFRRWLGVEGPTADHATIQVSNNGANWALVWENAGEVADDSWTTVTYDISSVADGRSTVFIRWGMGPTDWSWTYCGWNIDDVQILQTVPDGGGITVANGDVYIGWTEGESVHYNGYTRRDPDQRSWVHDPARGWAPLRYGGHALDLLVRARIAGETRNVPPGVLSITRKDLNPTSTSRVNFTVRFSKAVTGVDAADFALTAGGLTGVSIAGVSGSGSVYTVSVNTGTGDGTIRLDVGDNDSIRDSAGAPLGGPGAGNGNFTTGEVYAIDKTAPDTRATGPRGMLLNTTPAIPITFTAVDTGSGLRAVRLFYRKDGAGGFRQYGSDFTASPIAFDTSRAGGRGRYEFYTIGLDNAQNKEPAPISPDVTINIVGTAAATHWNKYE
jgi:Zn-dependent metalloprotease